MTEPYAPAAAMNYETIQVERDGRVGIVRWNRPDRLNAFNQTMYAEWIEAYDAFNSDPGIGAVVATGNGRAYSSGADIGGFERSFSGGEAPVEKEPPHAPFAPWYMAEGKPTIAAVNGVAVGIGFTSILWMDNIIASTEGRFSARFAAIGLTPELSSSWLLPRLIGLQRAKEMMLTGRIWSAEETRDLGLIREVVEPEDLLPTAIAQAAAIANNPDTSLRVIKRMMMEDLLSTDLTTIERRSSENFGTGRKSPEHREALLALKEKRPPRYQDVEYMAEIAADLATN
ncbi:MAG: enoyl-CoA hydratase-related protein [Chloroflexi bacterium]|nr:enoyl-CoA hydratase-related protein [Chloroflexota bacterium]MDA1146282.1 enoyl-CoA hydratase-related protein [Chloroflexota bacterium]